MYDYARLICKKMFTPFTIHLRHCPQIFLGSMGNPTTILSRICYGATTYPFLMRSISIYLSTTGIVATRTIVLCVEYTIWSLYLGQYV